MKQSRRQARERSRQTAEGAPGGGAAGAGQCPSCGTPLQRDANFCHRCGARLGESSVAGRWHAPTVVLYAVIGLAVVVAAVGIVLTTGEREGSAPAPVASAPPAATGKPVDLSTMSPREAADRLFNRVMMASEQGNMAEALQFAPMAIDAYGRVDRLDADAHYHMGLIYEIMGDSENLQRQIANIKRYAENHLLGLILEHDAAEQAGNAFGAARAAAAFAAAYGSEIMAGRPEYEAHRNTIEAFRAANASK